MSPSDSPYPGLVRIPADVEVSDQVLGPLTARQLIVLAVPAGGLYLLWQATREVVPVVVFLIAAAPLLAVTATLVGVRRDGLTLDRLLLAATRHHMRGTRFTTDEPPDRPVPAWLADAAQPMPGPSDRRAPRRWTPPARAVTTPDTSTPDTSTPDATGAGGRGLGIDGLGVIDLGADGSAVVAAASGVNLGLRTPAEQEAMVAGFGRYLHSLTAPVQIVVRAERIDLTDTITDLAVHARRLPDPGLADLADDHAEFLADLAARSQLLRRQILLVWRDPTPTVPTRHRGSRGRRAGSDSARRAVHDRLARQVGEAAALLAPIGITITGLDAARARMVVAAALNPASPRPPTGQAADRHEVITTATPHPATPGRDDRAGAADAWTGWVW